MARAQNEFPVVLDVWNIYALATSEAALEDCEGSILPKEAYLGRFLNSMDGAEHCRYGRQRIVLTIRAQLEENTSLKQTVSRPHHCSCCPLQFDES